MWAFGAGHLCVVASCQIFDNRLVGHNTYRFFMSDGVDMGGSTWQLG